MKPLTFLLFLFLLLIIQLSLFSLEEGDIAAKFVNPNVEGKYTLSKKVLGTNWVLLDFFATDCKGCIKELPEIEELYETYKNAGFTVLVFALDEEGAEVVKPYFEKKPTPLTILLDRFKMTAQKYGVDEIPAIFLINPEKEIVLKRVTYKENNIPDVKSILAEALDVNPSDSNPKEENKEEE